MDKFYVDCFYRGQVWHVEVCSLVVLFKEDEIYQILENELETYDSKLEANIAAKEKFKMFSREGDVLFLQP